MQFTSIFLICNFISVYTTAVAVPIQPNFALQVWIPVKGAYEQYQSVGYVKIDSLGALILGESSDPAAFYLEENELRLIGGERLVGAGKGAKLQLGGEGKLQWTISKKVIGGRATTIITPGSNLEIRGCFHGKTSLDMPFYLKPSNDHTHCPIQIYFEQM